MIKLPVTNQSNRSFEVTIPQGTTNITLAFFMYLNRIAEYWQMTITDVLTNTELINGLPLLTGNAPVLNRLGQWQYFDIGSMYILPISGDAPENPGLGDWDTNFIIVWD